MVPERHIYKKKKIYFGLNGFPIIAGDEVVTTFELDNPLQINTESKVPLAKKYRSSTTEILFRVDFVE